MTISTEDIEAAMDVIRAEEDRRGTRLPNGVHRDVPAAEYHAIKAVSATFLKAFILKTPAHAKAMLDGRLEAEGSAMCKGSALHAALLEPSIFAETYAIVPDCRRNSKEWAAHEQANPGRLLLKESESGDVTGMRDSAWGDPDVRRYLEACDERELTILWTDAATDLPCKARIDLYSTSLRIMLDVKTTGQMDRFHLTAFDLGYDIQLAFYERAISQYLPPPEATGILAIEQSCPYVPDIFEPEESWMAGGRQLVERAMPAVKECFTTNIWPGRIRPGQPTPLGVPAKSYRVASFDRGA